MNGPHPPATTTRPTVPHPGESTSLAMGDRAVVTPVAGLTDIEGRDPVAPRVEDPGQAVWGSVAVGRKWPALPGARAVVGAGVLVAIAVVWGSVAVNGAWVGLRAAPFAGRWEWHGGLGLVPAAAVAGVTVAWGPGAAARLRWRWVVFGAGAGAAAWTVALAAGDGWARLTKPLESRHEYEPLAEQVGGLGTFVHSYVDRLGEYPIHVQGHPPGPVVAAWLLDRIGLGGAGWLAAVAVAGWGVAVGASLVATRAVAGEAPARRAAPVLVLLPAAVWAGTSMDALFAGVVATGIAVTAVGAARRSRRLLLTAGMVLGAALLLTYGTVPLLLVAAAALAVAVPGPASARGDGGRWTELEAMVVTSDHHDLRLAEPTTIASGEDPPARRRRRRELAAALVVGVALVLVAARIAGFDWFAGLAATRDAYWSGIASRRPAAYLTLVGNPAVLAVALGPACVVGLVALVASLCRHLLRAPEWASQRGHDVRPDRSGGLGIRGPGPMTSTSTEPDSMTARELVLPAAALVAVVTADLSQFARGEVERIWLPFVPWLALAAAPLVAGSNARRWLAAQAAVGLAVQSVLVSRW